MKVALFVPCFVNVFAPQVAACTRKILTGQGIQVDIPLDQTCCGQPAFNAGHWDEARPVAEHFLDVFSRHEWIVAPSGSCVTMVKHFYERLFPLEHPRHDDSKAIAARTFELCEFLVRRLHVEDLGATFEGRATYHDACHALRELDVKEEPRRLLRHVKGLELVEMEGCETCCGFGGTFSVKHEPVASSMGNEKLGDAVATGADCLVTTDASCLLHIEGMAKAQGRSIRCLHIAEILAATGIER